jgi:hypothetical protein
MTRADLGPLPKESETRIERVRARHEVKIRSAFVNWRREKAGSRPPSLTAQQQFELQTQLVAMSAELGKTEGRERLSATPSPNQFEIEIHGLVEIVADEARDRWKSLTRGFHLEASPEGVYSDAERGVCIRVRELLREPCDDLILEAWCAHEKRLAAECEGDGCLVPLSATSEADTGQGPDISGIAAKSDPYRTSSSSDPIPMESPTRAGARQAVVMPILASKRWKRGRWATEAGVGKNSVYEYLDGRRTLTDENRKAMAEVLGLKPTDLPE